MDEKENVIEWLNGQKEVAVSFHDQKYINKVRKLAEKYPDKVTILAENNDGSIYAHLPRNAIKLNIVERELTEEQRTELTERLTKMRTVSQK